MKRFLLVLLAVTLLAGCGGKKSLKVEDPVQRAALRTRDTECPVDSLFTAKGVKTAFSVFSQVKPKAFIRDFKEAQSDTTALKPLEKIRASYAAVKEEHSTEYSPGLTIYSTIIFLVFIFLTLFKVIRAIFKND
ncbi:MAG: hypothetical protein HUJ89_00325 [Bacteroidales bacterium]|nr:hypothetical protein [Bacteroidales bacterium]